MPGNFRMLSWRIALSALAAASLAAPGDAAEPYVTFAFERGWVEFTIRQDGVPVPDVFIRVLDEGGTTFATGPADKDGKADFPIPRAASFLVEIKAGARTADPIRLFRTDAGIEPGRVLLSYGLRPCCRSMITKEPIIVGSADPPPGDPENPLYPWLLFALAVFSVGIAAASIRWLKRRDSSVPGSIPEVDS